MSERTSIEWCDSTWSPWEGCTKVGPGCDHCYAEGMNNWLRKGENWGPGAPRRIYSEDHWQKPVKWQRDALKFETLHRRRRRVFPSVCDPLDNEVHEVLRGRFWGLIRLTPAIDWLVLTKRIGNAKHMLPPDWGAGYPNVWLGATVVNQQEADRDIPKLLATPARVRFLSVEPMLGPINIADIQDPAGGICLKPLAGLRWAPRSAGGCVAQPHERIHWVICGGESSHSARPMHPDWARSLRDQCTAADVPFMFKQWGGWRPLCPGTLVAPEPCFHAFPDGQAMVKVGKNVAGRLLDGRAYDAFPLQAPIRGHVSEPQP